MVPNIPVFSCFLRTFPAVAPWTCFLCAPGTSESHLRSPGSTAPPPGHCFPLFPAKQAGEAKPPRPCGVPPEPGSARAGTRWHLRGLRVLVAVPEVSGRDPAVNPAVEPGAARDPQPPRGAGSSCGHPESRAPLPGHSGAQHSAVLGDSSRGFLGAVGATAQGVGARGRCLCARCWGERRRGRVLGRDRDKEQPRELWELAVCREAVHPGWALGLAAGCVRDKGLLIPSRCARKPSGQFASSPLR